MIICVDLGQSGDRSLGHSHPDRESGLSMWPATPHSPASGCHSMVEAEELSGASNLLYGEL